MVHPSNEQLAGEAVKVSVLQTMVDTSPGGGLGELADVLASGHASTDFRVYNFTGAAGMNALPAAVVSVLPQSAAGGTAW